MKSTQKQRNRLRHIVNRVAFPEFRQVIVFAHETDLSAVPQMMIEPDKWAQFTDSQLRVLLLRHGVAENITFGANRKTMLFYLNNKEGMLKAIKEHNNDGKN